MDFRKMSCHELRILASFLKNTCEGFKFWETADLQPATLLKSTCSEVFFKYFVYFLGIPILRNTSEWLLSCIAGLGMLSMHACCLNWLDILHNYVNLACLHYILRRRFQVKATWNDLLSKLLWVFLKNQWFFIIWNTLKGFISKPLELSVQEGIST